MFGLYRLNSQRLYLKFGLYRLNSQRFYLKFGLYRLNSQRLYLKFGLYRLNSQRLYLKFGLYRILIYWGFPSGLYRILIYWGFPSINCLLFHHLFSFQNQDWKSMFGSNDSGSTTDSPKSKSLAKVDLQEKKSSSTTSLASQGSSNSGSFVTMSQGQISIPDGTLTRGTIGSVTQDINKPMSSKFVSLTL